MNYSEKLKDPRWQKKRLEVMQRDNFTCVKCGEDKIQLQIHHLKYENEPWDVHFDFLQTLCKYCHEVVEFCKYNNINIISMKSRTARAGHKSYVIKTVSDEGFTQVLLLDNSNGYFQVCGSGMSKEIIELMNSLF